MKDFEAVAPGRLCLFGEHQDYLNLPVVALAIPLEARIAVSARSSNEKGRVLSLLVPQLKKQFDYDLDNLPPRQTSLEDADFALAALHESIEDGWTISHGAICTSTTSIVMQAGCSSSTAFTVAWILVLATLAKVKISDPMELARLAHKAEVLHFNAPGGTMDHVSIAVGGSCLRIGPGMWEIEALPNLSKKSGIWVLADSDETKDTFGHLKRCKSDRLELLKELGGSWDCDNRPALGKDKGLLLEATLTNRNCEAEASRLWREPVGPDGEERLGIALGKLMLRHHEALRDGLKLSTPRLEAMREAAMFAGAWGFKLVGSGGGGCAVAWCAQSETDVIRHAMKKAGARQTWIVQEPCPGARIEQN